MSENRKMVVTGGIGFSGSHLVELSLNRGCHVIVFDDPSRDTITNIEELPEDTNYEFIQRTVTNLPLLQNLFTRVDHVFHLTAIPSVLRSIENPPVTNSTNEDGTQNILLTSSKDNVENKLFITSSSSACEENRLGDVKRSCADISRAMTLSCRPKYTLEEELRGTISKFHF